MAYDEQTDTYYYDDEFDYGDRSFDEAADYTSDDGYSLMTDEWDTSDRDYVSEEFDEGPVWWGDSEYEDKDGYNADTYMGDPWFGGEEDEDDDNWLGAGLGFLGDIDWDKWLGLGLGLLGSHLGSKAKPRPKGGRGGGGGGGKDLSHAVAKLGGGRGRFTKNVQKRVGKK